VADPNDIKHLLRRTEYVARPDRVAALSGGTIAAAVDDVLNVPAGDVAIPPEVRFHDEDNNWRQWVFATKWWLERMVRTSPKPIQEKMAFFWHGHFCSEWGKVFDTKAMMDQNALFRNQGLGSLRPMAQTMALQPAMLLYLDNAENTKGSPNQNFARELLELFLLGVGNYTEADVEAATAAWTGHNIDWNTNTYLWRPAQHDNSNKTLFGITRNWNGPEIIDEILSTNAAGKKILAARFITRKLWEFFAYQAPSPAIVDEIALKAVASDFNVKQWVREILIHPQFYSTTAKQGMVRSPVDYVVAALYHTGLTTTATEPQWSLEDMGQQPFYPPNVAGWKMNRYWVNASAMGGRAGFARHLTWRLLDTRGDAGARLTLPNGSWLWDDLDDLDATQLVDGIAAAMNLELVPTSRTALINWATSEMNQWGGPTWWRTTNVLTLMLLVPEMHVA
jgi:uncharacterized protein (DUF1800 family)